MSLEIWQTTNQEPWVEALLSGKIGVKTRTSRPVVPLDAFVLLHASKAMWRGWKDLLWTGDFDKSVLYPGCIVGVAKVADKGITSRIITKDQRKWWDLKGGRNCAAEFAVRFKNIHRLKTPVPTKGFQSPFCRAKDETVEALIKANPYLRDLPEFWKYRDFKNTDTPYPP